MSAKKIIKGTFIYGTSAIVCRLLGFVIRIIISRNLEPSLLGISQMIMPFYVLLGTIAYGGVATIIIKKVSAYLSQGYTSKAKRHYIFLLIHTLIIISIISLITYSLAPAISQRLTGTEEYNYMIALIAIMLPFTAIHVITSAFFVGMEKPLVPSIADLTEQLIRIISLYMILNYCRHHFIKPSISIIFYSLLASKITSAIFLIICALIACVQLPADDDGLKRGSSFYIYAYIKEVFINMKLSFPLWINRILIQFIMSLEAVIIPAALSKNMGSDIAISTYGVITGMCFPLILFPETITSSFAQAMFPGLAASAEEHNRYRINKALSGTIFLCVNIGVVSSLAFIAFGTAPAVFLFRNTQVERLLKLFAIVCPGMYSLSMFNSILNALGKTGKGFYCNMVCQLIKLTIYVLFIPVFGVYGYLGGLLISYIVGSLMMFFIIKKETDYHPDCYRLILSPIFGIIICFILSYVLYLNITTFLAVKLVAMCVSGLVFVMLSGIVLIIKWIT